MPFLTETSASSSSYSASASTIAEHLRLRRPNRNQVNITETDPDPIPEIPSVIQSTRSKPSISSLFLSTFSSTNNETTLQPPTSNSKKKGNPFSQATLRGLGCTASASQQVSVPAMIRTSADWEAKKVKKKKKSQRQEQEKKKKKKKKSSKLIGNESNEQGLVLNEGSGNNNMSCGVIQDVWCGPGIGFSADAIGSVDCVVARRNVPARGKIDIEKVNYKERSCIARRTVDPDSVPFLDSDSAFVLTNPEPDFFGARYYRHARHPSSEGLPEHSSTARRSVNPDSAPFVDSDSTFVLTRSDPDFFRTRYYRHIRYPSPEAENDYLMGRTMNSHDSFREWRLDTDHMSYEQLLELGDKIGYVNTGLKEEDITRCLRKFKSSIINDLPANMPVHIDKKCIICQEEYEADDELGKLFCGHSFHILCIKQWLLQKKTCPVCKTEATARS